MYCIANWFNLADEACEDLSPCMDALYDIAVFRDFCGSDLGEEPIVDAETLLNFHDRDEVPNLLHGNEPRFYGDSAYCGKEQRERLREIASKAQDFTNRCAYRSAPRSDAGKETSRRKSAVRSRVAYPFLTLKRLWGFTKVRYRDLGKNANRAFIQRRIQTMPAMVNLVKWGRPLVGEVRPV